MKKFVFIAFAGICLFGCNAKDLDFDNIKGPNLSGTFGFPLGEVKYTLREIVENVGGDDLGLVEDSATQVLTIFYGDTIEYSAPDDLVQIDDITNQSTIPVPTLTGPTSPDVVIDESFSIAYDPQDGEELDSIYYNTGDLEATVVSTFGGDLSYTLTFENTKDLGTGVSAALSGNISDGGSDVQSQSLVNHVTRLTSTTSNEFTVNFRGTISLDATQSTDGTEEIRIDFAYRNQTFSAIYGKLGRDTLAVGNQEIDLSFFSDIGNQGIVFGNPKMRFDIRNSFGVPLGMDLSGVLGDDGEGGTAVNLSGEVISDPPKVDAATQLGAAVQSVFEINRENSNLDDLLANSPTRLLFNVSGITNPDDADLTQSNFLEPNSSITAYIEMEIPMDIKLEGLEQTDTISLGSGLNINDIDSAFLRVNTLNEFPFQAQLSMEIQDSTNATLYTIPQKLVLKAPFINVNGFVTDPSGATVDIPFSEEGIEAIGTGSHIVMTVALSTPESVTSRDLFVKLLGDYSLEIRVGIAGRLNVDL
ncbi:MAG: hypothetical protein AB8B73_11510 [Ekhidna sp.]